MMDMYMSILKKDLKRKKTMNLIIALFVILSTMFFASSVNNIVSVTGGIDRFLDMAGMKDYFAIVSEPDEGAPFGELLEKNEGVKSYSRQTFINCSGEMVSHNGKRVSSICSWGMLIPADDMCLKYFDEDNNVITSVDKGKVMITSNAAQKDNIKAGDTITIDMYGEKLELEMAGICKDAVLGSEMTGSPSFLVCPDDFNTLYSNDNIRKTSRFAAYIIEADDISAVSDIISDYEGVIIHGDRALVKMTYIVSISVAAILMVVSVFLILISFVVLRFTIGFTIAEEFREIGVMKAIGIKNRPIRALYLVKYLGIAVIGSVIGFFAAIPFGKILLDSIGSSMVLGNDHPFLIGILCSAAVVGLILLFCWSCTAKIKKLSPIDAVRNGQTGERFHKHRLISLRKSRLGASGFLSLNDVLSSPKQSAILVTVFTLCTLLVIVLSNAGKTLGSENMIYIVGATASDAYIDISSNTREVKNGLKTLDEAEAEMEKKLADNNIPGEVYVEEMYSASVEFEGKTSNDRFLLCKDTKASEYVYGDGTAPEYANEIALGYAAANEVGATVGDTVNVTVNGETKPFVVTGMSDSISNLGKFGRFHESFELPENAMLGTMAYQVNFDDHPDKKTIAKRVEMLKDIFNTENVFNCEDYVKDCTSAADAFASVKKLTLTVAVVIIILISVLLERSFISKEKSEIALQKAMGFRNSSVIWTHIFRFVILAGVSIVIAVLLNAPVTKLVLDPLFAMIGAVKGLKYMTEPVEIYLIFPAVILAAVVAGSMLTAFSTNRIKASDTSDIE